MGAWASVTLILGSCYRSHEISAAGSDMAPPGLGRDDGAPGMAPDAGGTPLPGMGGATPVWFLHTMRPLVDAMGYELRAVRVGPEGESRPLGRSIRLPLVEWKPNGESTVLVTRGPDVPVRMSLFMVTFSTAGNINERLIASDLQDPSSLSWSPDGSYFAYLTESESILHVHEASGAEVATRTLPGERRMAIEWLASSNDLLVTWRDLSTPGRTIVDQLSVAHHSSGFAPERLTLEEPAPADHGWSLRLRDTTDDGRWLVIRQEGRIDGAFVQRTWVMHQPSDTFTLLDLPPGARVFNAAEGASRIDCLTEDDTVFSLELGSDGSVGDWGELAARPMFWVEQDTYIFADASDSSTIAERRVGSTGSARELFRRRGCRLGSADWPRERFLFRCELANVWWERPTGAVVELPETVSWDELGLSPLGDLAATLVRREEEDTGPDVFDLHEMPIPPGDPELVHEGVKPWTRTSLGAASPWSPFGDAYYFLERRGGLFVRDLVTDDVFTVVEPDDTFLVQGFGFERRPRP